jgi:hypothetical protein
MPTNIEIVRAYLRALENGVTGAERGQQILTWQRFDIRNVVGDGDEVALEVLWVGILGIPTGSLPDGGEMRAHFGIFLGFRDGKIVSQCNYDCFEPF